MKENEAQMRQTVREREKERDRREREVEKGETDDREKWKKQ